MIHGRVGSLLEVGTGFHPELTGRENIYLSGAILGMRRAEIDRKFDDIAAFAEIERFLDTPVKRYSSGMYVRLAFAVAARLEPEILLIDEVLAVGDTMYQYKCLSRIRELVNGGATVMFVSHNLDSMQALCQRVLWLDQGQIRADGPAAAVIKAYLDHQEQQAVDGRKSPVLSTPGPLAITHVVLRDNAGREVTEFSSDEEITVEFTYAVDGIIESPFFSVGVSDSGSGLLFLATMLVDGQAPHQLSGSGTVSCRFHGVSLMPKAYQVWGSVRDERGLSDIVGWQQMAAFRVVTPPQQLVKGDRPISISHLKNDAPVYVPHEWSIR
jgi:lipopolysaccharide transport system ATP-binding protein